MKAKVITITREFGSGGRTIGKRTAEKLGYDFYDWNLVTEIAKESGFAPSFVEENLEDAQNYVPWLFSLQSAGNDLSDQLFAAQRKVILDLAEKGNCVIVGRCADYILRKRSDTLSCFVWAHKEAKKKRIVEEYGETEVKIDKRMKDKDKKRKAHYEYYTSRKWGKAFYYDLCLDSGILGIENCVSTIVSLAENFPGIQRENED